MQSIGENFLHRILLIFLEILMTFMNTLSETKERRSELHCIGFIFLRLTACQVIRFESRPNGG